MTNNVSSELYLKPLTAWHKEGTGHDASERGLFSYWIYIPLLGMLISRRLSVPFTMKYVTLIGGRKKFDKKKSDSLVWALRVSLCLSVLHYLHLFLPVTLSPPRATPRHQSPQHTKPRPITKLLTGPHYTARHTHDPARLPPTPALHLCPSITRRTLIHSTASITPHCATNLSHNTAHHAPSQQRPRETITTSHLTLTFYSPPLTNTPLPPPPPHILLYFVIPPMAFTPMPSPTLVPPRT